MVTRGRVLNIGYPFAAAQGGAAYRGRVELRALRARWEVDNVLVVSRKAAAQGLRPEDAADCALALQAGRSGIFAPSGVATFTEADLAAFRRLLRERNYDLVFFRYVVSTGLIREVRQTLPQARIVVDVDMLASRIGEQMWRLRPSLKTRFYLREWLLLRRYERRLFNQPFLFLMSNDAEIAWVNQHYRKPAAPGRVELLPNAMPMLNGRLPQPLPNMPSDYILFHGVLSSAVNWDAFTYFLQDIYPRIAPALAAHCVHVAVVGKGLVERHRDLVRKADAQRVALVGEVADIGDAIAGARFCLVPLRVGSGTKTRILEAAAYGKAVVTTPIGAEGFAFSEDALKQGRTAAEVAEHVVHLLARPEEAEAAGQLLLQKAQTEYTESAVASRLLRLLEQSS